MGTKKEETIQKGIAPIKDISQEIHEGKIVVTESQNKSKIPILSAKKELLTEEEKVHIDVQKTDVSSIKKESSSKTERIEGINTKAKKMKALVDTKSDVCEEKTEVHDHNVSQSLISFVP